MKNTTKTSWYMTAVGGLIGLMVSLAPISISVLAFNKLYYFVLIFIPVFICLFIRLFKGHKTAGTIAFASCLSLAGVYLTGVLLEAGDLVAENNLPWYELYRLGGIMLANVAAYGGGVVKHITNDIFNVIFILAYLAVGLMFSWEFILKPAPAEDDEYEYVYEDELEPDDEVIDRK